MTMVGPTAVTRRLARPALTRGVRLERRAVVVREGGGGVARPGRREGAGERRTGGVRAGVGRGGRGGVGWGGKLGLGELGREEAGRGELGVEEAGRGELGAEEA